MEKKLNAAKKIVEDCLGNDKEKLSDDNLKVMTYAVYGIMSAIKCSESDIQNALRRLKISDKSDEKCFLDYDYYSQIMCLLHDLLCIIRYDKKSNTDLELVKKRESITLAPVKQEHSFQEEGIITHFLDFCCMDIVELREKCNEPVLDAFITGYEDRDFNDYSESASYITDLCLDPVVLSIIADSFGSDEPVLETEARFDQYLGGGKWKDLADMRLKPQQFEKKFFGGKRDE